MCQNIFSEDGEKLLSMKMCIDMVDLNETIEKAIRRCRVMLEKMEPSLVMAAWGDSMVKRIGHLI